MEKYGKLRVSLHYLASKKQFIAHIKQDNNSIKTKTVSHGQNKTPEDAYKEMIAAAKLLAKEYRVEFVNKTQDQLMHLAGKKQARRESFSKSQIEKPLTKTTDENPLITKFGNEMAFKAMIKHAIKHYGIDRVVGILDASLALANEMKSEIAKRTSIISSANIDIARIILKTRQQGIDMPSPTKEIEAAVQWVIENNNKPKRPSKAEPDAIYELQGEKWNGNGHAPASFSKFLLDNENNSLDDLRVS